MLKFCSQARKTCYNILVLCLQLENKSHCVHTRYLRCVMLRMMNSKKITTLVFVTAVCILSSYLRVFVFKVGQSEH